jgi:REP element-mobilizing transposase RayT
MLRHLLCFVVMVGTSASYRYFYRRHLPHWQPEGKLLFVTWRLWGSLPRLVLSRLREQAEREKAKQRAGASSNEFFVSGAPAKRGSAVSRIAAKQFLRIDRILDRAEAGPLWLKDSKVADIVVETLKYAAGRLNCCELHAYVVMANHVHLLMTPRDSIARITKSIKGYSARKANTILKREGAPFWQDESFDHWVRSERSFWRIKDYIERNPVKAGLAAKPGDWPWSSASPATADEFTGGSRSEI